MKKYSKKHLLILSVISGLILSIGWPMHGISVLLFFGFIPIFIIEDEIFKYKLNFGRMSVFLYTYPAFLLWNFLTTYWLIYSTIVGGIVAIVLNAMFMSLFVQLFHFIRKVLSTQTRASNTGSYFIFIVLWISYEYLHLNWELSWSWLQLGNGFANMVKSIQWYEYTGVLGGTFWILLVNILFFQFYKTVINPQIVLKRKIIFSCFPFISILLPFSWSLGMYYVYEEKHNPVEITVVQPNIDPYSTKFNKNMYQEIWNILFEYTKNNTTPNTSFVVWPETSVPGSMNFRNKSEYSTEKIIEFLRNEGNKNYMLIAGADAYEIFDTKKSSTSRRLSDGSYYYDAYNSAIQFDTSGIKNFYHKAKLVPGIEKMPYPKFFGFLERFAINLGGTSGSLGTSQEPEIFTDGKTSVAPVICYESIYGEYVSEFIKKGAQLIFIMTNDGWWKNSPGHRQHFQYARLRAIENRRSVARSANTGISCFINQRGDIIQQAGYWKTAALTANLNKNDHITVYTMYGDYLGKMSLFASVLIFLILLVKKVTVKNIKHL